MIKITVGKTSIETSERTEKGKNIISFPNEYVVIDIETTGLSPKYDSIIELSAIKIKNNKIVDEFQSLVKPVPYEMSLDQLDEEKEDAIKEAQENNEKNFDINFIYDKSLDVLHKPLKNDFTDTMRIARCVLRNLSHHRLSDLAEYYAVSYEGAHRALNDCRITQEYFLKLQESILKEYSTFEEFEKQIKSKSYSKIKVSEIVSIKDSFDESHPLFGKYCVFTGTLEKMVRKDAMQIVVDFGGFVETSVTAKTNYLILGNNDYCATIKDGKSSKQKKAESLKLKGNDIEIIPENVFYDMITD